MRRPAQTGRVLADRMPPHSAITIVMRQRPVMVAAELGAMALGHTALLVWVAGCGLSLALPLVAVLRVE